MQIVLIIINLNLNLKHLRFIIDVLGTLVIAFIKYQ